MTGRRCDIKAKTRRKAGGRRKKTARDLTAVIAEVLEDKKALDVKIIDVRKITPLTEYLVICTAESGPQMRAISQSVEDKLKATGEKLMRWEGMEISNWMILDIGNIVVHVMGEEERRRYDLEGLFGKKAIVYHL